MKRVAVIQARSTSTRLPGKILMDLAGVPMLARIIRRVRQASRVDEVVVATTTNAGDDAVVSLAEKEGVAYFRGDEHDVLRRFAGAVAERRADVVIRITADCPLIDPTVIDRVVGALEDPARAVDYASNVIQRSYPRGLDTEALHRDVLDRIERLATSPTAREHVTTYVRSERPDLFLCADVVDDVDNSDLRWTVDVPADLELVRTLYTDLDLDAVPVRSYREVVDYVRSHPHLLSLNAGAVTWNPGT